MGQRKQNQETFRYLNFPDWDNGTTHTAARALTLNSMQSQEFSWGEKSSPSGSFLTIHSLRPLRPSARLPEHSRLPALGFSGPLGRCSKPQAGIAASRHRANSSASLLLVLLLSKSLTEPLGAVILNHRKGLWGALPLATPSTTPRESGGAQGMVGIVVLRLRPSLAVELSWRFLQT